jgi:hypothetical protein
MRRQHSRTIAFAWSAFLFCGPACLPATRAAQSPREELAESLDGRLTDPFRTSGVQLTVLIFVRTDCPIANRYAPEIQRLGRKYRGQANFWLVYPDKSESATRIREHLEEFKYAMPALRDVHHALVARAQATITPEAAVFNKLGKLTYHGRIDNWYQEFGRSRPAANTHELDAAIRDALNDTVTAPAHVNAVGCYISDLK